MHDIAVCFPTMSLCIFIQETHRKDLPDFVFMVFTNFIIILVWCVRVFQIFLSSTYHVGYLSVDLTTAIEMFVGMFLWL